MTAVSETFQDCPSEPLVAEDPGPVFERQIRGHNQALSLTGRADYVEQQLRNDLPGRHVSPSRISRSSFASCLRTRSRFRSSRMAGSRRHLR